MKGAEEAAKAEMESAERRRDLARGPKRAERERALERWKETAKGIGDCSEAGKCAGWIEERFGDTCAALELDAVRKPEDETKASEAPPVVWSRTVYRFCPQETHSELIEWFCNPRTGQGDVPNLVYLGDREIILGKLETWNRRTRASARSRTSAAAAT